MKRAVFIDRDGVLIEAPKIDNKPKSINKLNEINYIFLSESQRKL